ncbi:macro domain-containing protein [Myxococcota bacterium]|nr:macro domain-containing protein [Myxococcota bacterium]
MSHANNIHLDLIIKCCLPTELEAQAIVIPTSSQGYMSQGTGALIKSLVGDEIEKEILEIAPLAIGSAAVTSVGNLEMFRKAIHVPNRLMDASPARIEHIRQSVRAGLVAAKMQGFESIVIPGPGPCANHISKKEIARAIIDEIRNFRESPPETVYLVDTNEIIVRNLEGFAFPQK